MSELAQTKLDNFKAFLKQISNSPEHIETYDKMSLDELYLLASWVLPGREITFEEAIRERLDYDEKHSDKVRRYLELFVKIARGDYDSDSD